MSTNLLHPITLIILDGFGYSKEREANAIAAAHTPIWDNICKHYPYMLISGSGLCVGLPDGQMGNSEVGHMNIGAGRIVQQDLTRIDDAISQNAFFNNIIINNALQQAYVTQKAFHIMGLLSPGGVHSHERHFHAMIKMAALNKIKQVYLHIFLDGRDTPPKSAEVSLEALEEQCRLWQCGQIVSLIGRYYAMDRDHRWERVQKAYDLITQAKAEYEADTPIQGLNLAYARGETDEFVQPTIIRQNNTSRVTFNEGDIAIMMNFRADRAREITEAFTCTQFTGFQRTIWPVPGQYVCLTEYDTRYALPVAFPSPPLTNIFSHCVSQRKYRQLRMAETEKYAHVTFFFNGGLEQAFPLEDRLLIPSPHIATYDLQPQMSALEVTEQLIQAIKRQYYDVIICNFANPDMLGHTGNFEATVKAIEIVDQCLGKILAESRTIGNEIIITADHGNAEMMFDKTTQQPHTAHTNNPIPFLYIGRNAMIIKENGKLSDIAPTMLYLMNIPIPSEMTGTPLVKLM
jgi:2,3-bisphosphoglycerate-independent phosphoglycerate mutase